MSEHADTVRDVLTDIFVRGIEGRRGEALDALDALVAALEQAEQQRDAVRSQRLLDIDHFKGLANREREAREQAERDRDEARRNADGMARAPYGEFQAMREARDEARAALVAAERRAADAHTGIQFVITKWCEGQYEHVDQLVADLSAVARALLAGSQAAQEGEGA